MIMINLSDRIFEELSLLEFSQASDIKKNIRIKSKGNLMYIAMNRFKIALGREKDFEKIWIERDTHLDNVPGFIEFHLVKGNTEETHTLYASHSTWRSKKYFINWTKSDAFRQAHKGAKTSSNIYLGHPVFEGFDVII